MGSLVCLVFVKAGWSLVFQPPRDSGDTLACVALAGAQLMLGTSSPQFLPTESRAHKGAGVEFHLTVPGEEIGAIYEAHRRFLIAAERAELADPPSDTAT